MRFKYLRLFFATEVILKVYVEYQNRNLKENVLKYVSSSAITRK